MGSRIVEVHNGSSLFTGDAGSGESNARRYMIENDLVEAVIALPENHCASLSANLTLGNYLLVEMADHHFSFFRNRERLTFDKGPEFFLRLLLIEHRVILYRLFQAIIAIDGRVVLQHIQNKPFLNGLLHRVYMEGTALHLSLFIKQRIAIRIRYQCAECLQRLVFRRGCKGKVAGVGQQCKRSAG